VKLFKQNVTATFFTIIRLINYFYQNIFDSKKKGY